MNKFTKISATALLALFLTACDKPADKAPETKPEAAQTQAVSEVKVDEKGDYQKLVDWNKAQEQTQLQSQQKFQQDLVAAVQAQDEKKVKEAIETFNQSVKDTITSLDALDVKAESIKSIKEQTKNVLSLASGLLVDQANMSFTNPTQTPEQQKAYAEKAEALRNAMSELQKQSVELEQKFNSAPVAAPAQEAK
ncbi:lipoprotein HlpB [Aggregatibacter segnis]|uniref:lipoprotein HlpB n=1 Tax=Aggregatibacter segnis TaxID=739 RepID=UPI003FA14971